MANETVLRGSPEPEIKFSDGRVMIGLSNTYVPSRVLTSEGCGTCGDLWTLYIPAGMDDTARTRTRFGFSATTLIQAGRRISEIPLIHRRNSRVARPVDDAHYYQPYLAPVTLEFIH